MIARGRGYTFDIVGEGARQAALNRICGGKCENGHNLRVTAQLVPVPGEPIAIAVHIQRAAVGFIPAEASADLRAEIVRVGAVGGAVYCHAKIVGGWDHGDGDEGHYGVRLSISSPLRLEASPPHNHRRQ